MKTKEIQMSPVHRQLVVVHSFWESFQLRPVEVVYGAESHDKSTVVREKDKPAKGKQRWTKHW